MRFSLRALLLAVLLAAIPLALVANRYHGRQRAWAILMKNDVGVTWRDAQGPLPDDYSGAYVRRISTSVGRIHVHDRRVEGELLWAIRQFREAKDVRILHADVGAAECRALTGFPHLTSVSFGFDNLDPAALGEIAKCRNLETIYLLCTNISDEGCVSLCQCATLTNVGMAACDDITDEGLLALAKLPRLRSIIVNSNLITKEGIERFLESCPGTTLTCIGKFTDDDDWWDELGRRYPNWTIHR